MRALDIIEGAVRDAKARGIRVHRGGGAIFDWSGSDGVTPTAVDATGAVLLTMGMERQRVRGWTKELQEHLGVGVWWWWRFFRGWSYGQHIQVAVRDKSGNIVGWKDDDVSKMADRLAKRLMS